MKAILLYSAETWPLTITETQRLEAVPEVADKDSKRLIERYGSQRKYSGANWPGKVGAVSPGTSVEMVGARA